MQHIFHNPYLHLSPQEYIHRGGRTARGEGAQGRALLFLTPNEIGFLRYLKVREGGGVMSCKYR